MLTLKEPRLFVGRERERGLIQAFYQKAVQEDRFSVLWIEGEVGIGKTMLLAQDVYRVRESGAIVISVRFYQEALNSVVNLVAEAIRVNPGFDRFLKEPIAPTARSVATAIERLSSLRPTILLVEDIHFLPAEATAELSRLIQMLSDISVGMICTALPGECPARTTLLPWMSDRLSLPPLNLQEVETWLQTVNPSLAEDPQFVAAIHQATQGLPLLLESTFHALRKHHEKLESDLEELIFKVREQAAFSTEEVVLRFTANMNAEEVRAVEGLAIAGEIFSQESADILLAKKTALLSDLASKGIIAQASGTLSPFSGKKSQRPLWQFSHTLIYNYFLETNTATPEKVIELIQERTPIYSIAPFAYLAITECSTSTRATEVFQLLYSIVSTIPHTQHWLSTQQLCRLLLAFYQNHRQALDPTEAFLRLNLQQLYVSSLKESNPFSDETVQAINDYLKIAEAPATLIEAEHRLRALQSFIVHRSRIPQQVEESLNEFEELSTQFPTLKTCSASIEFLTWLAKGIRINPADQQVQRLQILFDQIQQTGSSSVHPHQQLELSVAMLRLYTSPKVQEEKKRIAAQVQRNILEELPPDDVWSAYILFLFEAGEVRSGWNMSLHLLEHKITHGSQPQIDVELHMLYAAGVFGAPLHYIKDEVLNLIDQFDMPRPIDGTLANTTYIQIAASMHSISIGQVFDNYVWSQDVLTTIGGDDPFVSEVLQLAFIDRQSEETTRNLLEHNAVPERIRFFAEAYVQGTENLPEEEIVKQAEAVFAKEVVNRASFYTLRTTITFLERIQLKGKDASGSLADRCKKQIGLALHKGLDWCYRKELLGFMEPLLSKSATYLSRTEQDEWMIRVQKLRSCLANEPSFPWTNPDTRLSLTMTGTIGIKQSYFSHRRIQGGRSRQVLGLMVINELMGQRLSLEEFREVAVGIEGNPHEAANTTRVVISRLRGILGKEAIIADGKSAPRLNLNHLRVDLLEAVSLLKRATNAARASKPREAFQNILAALSTVASDPAYPGLYGDFFDAARLDFEQLLRTSLLSVSALLNEENDLENRVVVLEQGLAFMPDDEELLAMLVENLIALGRNTEALNVRRRFERRRIAS